MNNVKALIVDDEYYITRTIAYLLRREGLDCHTANDGKEALALLDRESFMIIFLDINMPDIDGLEVCRRLRLNPLQMGAHVIIISASAQEMIYEQGLTAGADDFITKPFDPDAILARVREIAGKAA